MARLRAHHGLPLLLRHLEPAEQEPLRDLHVVQHLVVVAAGFRRGAAHREAPGGDIDERHPGERVDRRAQRGAELFFGAHTESPEAAVRRHHADAVAGAERVLLAHFGGHEDAEALVEAKRGGHYRTNGRLLNLEFGLDDAARRELDPETSVREQVAARLAANHRGWRLFLVVDHPDSRTRTLDLPCRARNETGAGRSTGARRARASGCPACFACSRGCSAPLPGGSVPPAPSRRVPV